LEGYNYFLIKKERELRVIIDKLNLKNAEKNKKDERIARLEGLAAQLRG